MAIRPKPCGCDCSAQTSACDCGGTVCGLVCRKKAGDAVLCGFAEYADPSTPPKMYRTQTPSGEITGCAYDICPPGGSPGGPADDASGFKFQWSGSYVYDKSTCAETNTQLETFFGGASGPCGISGSPLFVTTAPKIFGPSNSGASSLSITPTKKTWTTAQICENAGQVFSGQSVAELTDEDTEDDAENRANAAIPDWSACGSGCGDPTCTAFRSERGDTDIGWGYRNVQTKAQWTAVIGVSYKVTVRFGERPVGGGGAFIFFGLIHESTITADSTSEETAWIDVPNETGRETIALSCLVEVVP